jgi:carbonic anhydrase/acetyltransferase-like protein (isoleucine patch superfamily)
LTADWVATNAVLVGDVTLGSGSSVWHGTKLRGDTCPIKIGNNSIVQDNSRIGSNSGPDAAEINIGDNVYIGANANVDAAADLESFSYVGMGASVGKGATVQSFGVLAAGAVLPDGETVPSG